MKPELLRGKQTASVQKKHQLNEKLAA